MNARGFSYASLLLVIVVIGTLASQVGARIA